MKTRILNSIIGCFILIILFGANLKAQTTTAPTQSSVVAPHNVGVSSTHIYDVAYTVRGIVPNIYTWAIFTASAGYVEGAAAVAGVDYNITAGANASIKNIKWLKAGNYVIELLETNPVANGSCAGVVQKLNILVGPTGTVEFLNSTGTNQCALAGAYSVDLSYTGTISYPITVSVQYTINGATSTANISVATAIAKLDIPLAVDFLNSTTTDDVARSVKITGVKDSFGGDLAINPKDTHTLTIWTIPATTPIHHD